MYFQLSFLFPEKLLFGRREATTGNTSALAGYDEKRLVFKLLQCISLRLLARMINVALALKGNEKGLVIISSEEVNLPL